MYDVCLLLRITTTSTSPLNWNLSRKYGTKYRMSLELIHKNTIGKYEQSASSQTAPTRQRPPCTDLVIFCFLQKCWLEMRHTLFERRKKNRQILHQQEYARIDSHVPSRKHENNVNAAQILSPATTCQTALTSLSDHRHYDCLYIIMNWWVIATSNFFR